MRPFEFDFQTGGERLLHQRHGRRIRRINMLHQQLAIIECVGQRNHPGSENIARPEFARFHHHISTNHIRHMTAHLLKITNVIARQLSILLL